MSIPEKVKWAPDLDRIRGRPMFFAEREPTTGTNFGLQGPCDGQDPRRSVRCTLPVYYVDTREIG